MNDDLAGWEDDPVVRALTAPGTDAELAGERAALAAFRCAAASRSRRRYAHRLTAGTSIVVVALGLSGGVAAAFSRELPSPIQRVAHHLLGPVGVPAPAPHHVSAASHQRTGHSSVPSSATTPVTSTAPTPAASTASTPSPPPSHRAVARAAGAGASPRSSRPATTPVVVPSQVATTAPASSPSPSPVTTPAVTPPASTLVLSVADTRLAPGATDAATATVDDPNGAPVAGQRVALMQRLVGETEWSQVAQAETDGNGQATYDVPPVTHDVVFRLTAKQNLHSDAIRVVVVPSVAATVSPSQGSSSDVTVQANGAQPGDLVTLKRRQDGQWQAVGSGNLDGSGATTFAVPTPSRGTARYRATLQATSAHASATTAFQMSAH